MYPLHYNVGSNVASVAAFRTLSRHYRAMFIHNFAIQLASKTRSLDGMHVALNIAGQAFARRHYQPVSPRYLLPR